MKAKIMKAKILILVSLIVFFLSSSSALAFRPAGEEFIGASSAPKMTRSSEKGDSVSPRFKTRSEQVTSNSYPRAESPRVVYKTKTVYKPVAVPSETTSYTVVRGDTLDKIAKSFGTRREVLMALNSKIKNPNRIQAGWVLKVPAPPKAEQEKEGVAEQKLTEAQADVEAKLAKTESAIFRADEVMLARLDTGQSCLITTTSANWNDWLAVVIIVIIVLLNFFHFFQFFQLRKLRKEIKEDILASYRIEL